MSYSADLVFKVADIRFEQPKEDPDTTIIRFAIAARVPKKLDENEALAYSKKALLDGFILTLSEEETLQQKIRKLEAENKALTERLEVTDRFFPPQS